jgi:hypothetical protein
MMTRRLACEFYFSCFNSGFTPFPARVSESLRSTPGDYFAGSVARPSVLCSGGFNWWLLGLLGLRAKLHRRILRLRFPLTGIHFSSHPRIWRYSP